MAVVDEAGCVAAAEWAGEAAADMVVAGAAAMAGQGSISHLTSSSKTGCTDPADKVGEA